ncbi:hypothetical protein D3C84_1219240 [compost metagenome]
MADVTHGGPPRLVVGLAGLVFVLVVTETRAIGEVHQTVLASRQLLAILTNDMQLPQDRSSNGTRTFHPGFAVDHR